MSGRRERIEATRERAIEAACKSWNGEYTSPEERARIAAHIDASGLVAELTRALDRAEKAENAAAVLVPVGWHRFEPDEHGVSWRTTEPTQEEDQDAWEPVYRCVPESGLGDHVSDILFDAMERYEPDCLLCQKAQQRGLFAAYGYTDADLAVLAGGDS